MNNDLISREALRNVILNDSKLDGTNANWEVNRILVHIDNAPTVEPICPYLSDDEVKQPCLQAPCERPQGEWIYNKRRYQYVCSKCGEIPTKYTGCALSLKYLKKFYLYCPNCGADIKGGGTNE